VAQRRVFSQNAGMRDFGQPYRGEHLARVAFPLGGIGAGMLCLEGSGALSQLSLRHRPEIFSEPLAFAAICLKGAGSNLARLIEGPVPLHKPLFPWHRAAVLGSGSGAPGRSYGLPRLGEAEFEARFPFAQVRLRDPSLPLAISITGWSPFIPGQADDSSLPVAALEYGLRNLSDAPVDAIFSFHSANFMLQLGGPPAAVREISGGFALCQSGSDEKPELEGAFSAALDAPEVDVDCRWFRGGWFDPLTMLWKSVADGRVPSAAPYEEGPPSAGASLYAPLVLAPREERTLCLRLAWYVPASDLRTESGQVRSARQATGDVADGYRPWYAGRFADIEDLNHYWAGQYARLREETTCFADCLHESTLPAEVMEAVAANLSILRSPTLLRQADGRLWAFEGCGDAEGCCPGSCTHVWNYAQALPHLFPELERGLRETEFGESQDAAGHQSFRASLPIREAAHDFHAAADGQLGGVLKAYRDWRISGDTGWLRRLWPRIKSSLQYAIETWDPDRQGWLIEPHHNTYDIEFWGPESMCTSFYLAALRAAAAMAEVLGSADDERGYLDLYDAGRERFERELYNGEYFFQRVQWQGLRGASPLDPSLQRLDHDSGYSPEAVALLRREGPKYQYGDGCLSDGVLGAWMAEVCGLGSILDREKVRSHLCAVHGYNLRHDLSTHANPQRSGYAFGREGGLLLCSWPRGGEPSLPFAYSNEVWTGIEYQVAAHLIMHGHLEEGLEVVRLCRRRYDGSVRNPFDEIECGHFYARALSSYSLLQALSGARYDAVEKKLTLHPAIAEDFRAFISTATGFGHVGVREGRPFLEVRHGEIELREIDYAPAPQSPSPL
jgi:uncharacterized protein (DUF608 family)